MSSAATAAMLTVALLAAPQILNGQPTPNSGASTGRRSSRAASVKAYFEKLDHNKNGKIEPREVPEKSRMVIAIRAREAGLDPSMPLAIQDLVDFADRLDRGRQKSSKSPSQRQSRPVGSSPDQPRQTSPSIKRPVKPSPSTAPTTQQEKKYSRQDLIDATILMAQFDRNKDHQLDKEEVAQGTWREDPFEFDGDGSGTINPYEMTLRIAAIRKKKGDSAVAGKASRGGSSRRVPRKYESRTAHGGPPVYRLLTVAERLPDGLPRWFGERDVNGDGQVAMAEYSGVWSNRLIDEYFQFDINRDNVITPKECLATARDATPSEYRPRIANDATDRSSVPPPASLTSLTGGKPVSTNRTQSPQRKDHEFSDLSRELLQRVDRTFKKYDANRDHELQEDEWSKMAFKPAAADVSGDGNISVSEYARWMKKQDGKR